MIERSSSYQIFQTQIEGKNRAPLLYSCFLVVITIRTTHTKCVRKGQPLAVALVAFIGHEILLLLCRQEYKQKQDL